MPSTSSDEYRTGVLLVVGAALLFSFKAVLVKLAYRYQVEELPLADSDAPSCYRLRIENLTMTQTLAGEDHPLGGNLIDVVVGFRGDAVMRQFHALLRGRVVREPDLWDPADGRFTLEPEDFREF